ncbi:hypothetical protein DL93DRAFT_1807973 [Clavulina sp. PMI_390]|nr:hypothetical protein DL93DRAFT_1807973 [Clavulina sp. PMI_390]
MWKATRGIRGVIWWFLKRSWNFIKMVIAGTWGILKALRSNKAVALFLGNLVSGIASFYISTSLGGDSFLCSVHLRVLAFDISDLSMCYRGNRLPDSLMVPESNVLAKWLHGYINSLGLSIRECRLPLIRRLPGSMMRRM